MRNAKEQTKGYLGLYSHPYEVIDAVSQRIKIRLVREVQIQNY